MFTTINNNNPQDPNILMAQGQYYCKKAIRKLLEKNPMLTNTQISRALDCHQNSSWNSTHKGYFTQFLLCRMNQTFDIRRTQDKRYYLINK